MHARHRTPGNGYRSNAMGVGGVATASRVSPESSMRGRGFNNSEYRNYNRGGFGRGQRRQFQPPQLPPRKGDIFMEAGKLAAEYLVSKGLLPPNALSGKWHNGSLKNLAGDFRNVRSQERDGVLLSAFGQTSAHTRTGNAAPDIGPDRRRYFEEYNSMGSRSDMGGRKKSGSLKNYGSAEWNRELGRSGSWSERARDSPDMGVDDDSSSVNKNDQQVVGKGGDTGLQNSPLSAETPNSGSVGDAESTMEINKSIDNPNENEKAISSDTKMNLTSEAVVERTEESGDMKRSDEDGGEVKDENINDNIEQQHAEEDIAVEPSLDEKNQETKNTSELLRFCRFANFTTKPRSSLTPKSATFDQCSITELKDSNAGELPSEPGTNAEDVPVESSSIDDSSNLSHNSKSIDCDVKKAPAVEDDQGLAYASRQESSTNLTSFPEKSLMQEQTGNNGLHGFGRSGSMVMARGEKRALEDDKSWDGTKKPKEFAPSVGTTSDGSLGLSISMETPQISEEPMTSNFEGRPDQKRLMDMSLFPRGDFACVDYAEKKQLLPGSLKTFDLNLMEASEVNENHDAQPIIAFPSITESGKQAMPIDVDLSMSNNDNASDKYDNCGSHVKHIEVIDLENDSLQGQDAFSGTERRTETEFSGLDGFPNNPTNNGEIPDVQDGYGCMIMELLGNDIPNCSSVPPDMNSLHNDIGLHNGEGILGDDDSIYMTLGEIPTSFLRVWEQPTQEYGKPF